MIAFEKIHANGDDFIVVDLRHRDVPLPPDLIRSMGDRQPGIGFNQLAALSQCDDATARLLFWNADGTPLDACGSATRGVALKLMEESGVDVLTVRTSRDVLRCARHDKTQIAVYIGPPLLHWSKIPLATPVETDILPLAGEPAACSMGDPQCTFFVEDAEQVNVEARGRAIETDPLFLRGRMSISCRSSRVTASDCASGNASRAFPPAQGPTLAPPSSTVSAAASWRKLSRFCVTAAFSEFRGTGSTAST